MKNHQKVLDNNQKKRKVFKRKVLIRWIRRKVSNLIRRVGRYVDFFFRVYVENCSRTYSDMFTVRYRKDPAFRDRFKGDVNSKRKYASIDKPKTKNKNKDLQIKELKDTEVPAKGVQLDVQDKDLKEKELKENLRDEEKNKSNDKPKIEEKKKN
jgi:hypothetical protein